MNCLRRLGPAVIAAGAIVLLPSSSAHAFDADLARVLAKRNDCLKCHAIEKEKKAPSYKKIAAKYKGKEAEGEASIVTNITTGARIKLADGSEEEHAIIDTKDPQEIQNLVAWILAQ